MQAVIGHGCLPHPAPVPVPVPVPAPVLRRSLMIGLSSCPNVIEERFCAIGLKRLRAQPSTNQHLMMRGMQTVSDDVAGQQDGVRLEGNCTCKAWFEKAAGDGSTRHKGKSLVIVK
jgi:hypothetical protein